jgi:hypothetical protein
MTSKTIIAGLVALAFVAFPLNDAYSMKASCAEDIDIQEYPICKYISEWNESEEFGDKVYAELVNRADEINANPGTSSQIHQEIRDKINQENPGLEEKCQKLKDWIYEQIRAN